MFLIVGLGNPGKKYENTRHNLGFITIDYLAEKLDLSLKKNKFKSLIGEGRVDGQKVVLMKPQTYMNNSGEAVREIMAFFKLSTDRLIVIYDDIDIPLGSVRIRKKGSSGTHNGMKSIIYSIKSEDFPRIRIGIGRGDERIDLISHVIGGFQEEEVAPLREAVKKAAEGSLSIISVGIDKAMNLVNIRNKKEK